MAGLRSILSRLRREDGISLVMAMGILGALSIATASVVFFAGQNAKSVERSNADTRVFSLAETGVAEALSKLSEFPDPTTGTLNGTLTNATGTVSYSGTVQPDGDSWVWTITSDANVKNPSGGGTADLTRKVVQRARVRQISATADPELWDRFFHNRTNKCLTVDTVDLPGNVTTRGDLCLENGARILNNSTATGTTTVRVGDDLFIGDADSSVGAPGSGNAIPEAFIGDRCRYQAGNAATTQSSPNCDATTHVYADSLSEDRRQLLKPQVDFDYWYDNADLGPHSDCSVGSFPGDFDNAAKIRDGVGATTEEITPRYSSYSCIKNDDTGQKVAELSWNRYTNVLTIEGTIFIDGDIRFDDDGQIVNYVGRGVIFAGDDVEFDEEICAGTNADGSVRSCYDDTSNWDPNEHLMVVVSDGWSEYDQGGFLRPAAFQGVIYAKQFCLIHQAFHSSGPVVCEEVRIEENDEDQGGGWPTFYSWPKLQEALPDALVYSETGETVLEVELLEQTG